MNNFPGERGTIHASNLPENYSEPENAVSNFSGQSTSLQTQNYYSGPAEAQSEPVVAGDNFYGQPVALQTENAVSNFPSQRTSLQLPEYFSEAQVGA